MVGPPCRSAHMGRHAISGPSRGQQQEAEDLIEMSWTAYVQFNPRLDKEGVMPVQEEACRAKQV